MLESDNNTNDDSIEMEEIKPNESSENLLTININKLESSLNKCVININI